MKALIAAMALVLMGCASAEKRMNNVSLGMSKAEVISVLGTPNGAAATDGVEYLKYNLKVDPTWSLATREYFIRLINGKVEAYGQRGDFDSTEDPSLNINIK